jgi:hypothetical protein
LLTTVLPPDAYVPSFYKLKKIHVMPPVIFESTSCVILNVKTQLLRIIERNYDSVISYCDYDPIDRITDIQQGEVYKQKCDCHPILSDEMPLSLILFTDGIPLMTSRNVSYWPILATIAELPPRKRIQLGNMLLLGLHKGGKPTWECYLNPLINEIRILHDTPLIIKRHKFRVRFLIIVMDAQAKASVLNVNQHNGKYGCPYCLAAGDHVEGRRLYRYDDTIPKRTNEQYLRFLTMP